MLLANQIAGFFKMQYLKKEVNHEVYFWHVDSRFSTIETIILSVCIQACSKYPKKQVCISLHYLQKNVGDEVEFLPADKHDIFLQVDSINLDVCCQACPKYPK